MNTVEALRAAKKRLEERGWCKGAFVDNQGACCAVGAVREVGGLTAEEALKVLDDVVYPGTIVGFNDSPHTTKEEVLALFDKAIEVASSQP